MGRGERGNRMIAILGLRGLGHGAKSPEKWLVSVVELRMISFLCIHFSACLTTSYPRAYGHMSCCSCTSSPSTLEYSFHSVAEFVDWIDHA